MENHKRVDNPLVTIIIPTTPKELPLAERCAKAVKDSTYKNTEVLIVNEGKERSEQRNIGIQRTNSEYLLILDADQVVNPYLIEECVELMETTDAVGIYLPEVVPGNYWFNRVRNFEGEFYTGTCIGVVRFVRVPVPLFDTTLAGGEDTDWDRRIKGKKLTAKNCYYHYDHITLKDYIKKKTYYATYAKRFIEKYPDDKILKLRWRCFGVFVENGKWKKILRHPLLSLGVLFIITIRGYIWLRRKR